MQSAIPVVVKSLRRDGGSYRTHQFRGPRGVPNPTRLLNACPSTRRIVELGEIGSVVAAHAVSHRNQMIRQRPAESIGMPFDLCTAPEGAMRPVPVPGSPGVPVTSHVAEISVVNGSPNSTRCGAATALICIQSQPDTTIGRATADSCRQSALSRFPNSPPRIQSVGGAFEPSPMASIEGGRRLHSL